MRHFALILAVAGFTTLPLHAQEDSNENGFSLMEEGAKLFFRGILQEMEPAMKDLRGFADEMEPALRKFVQEMGPAFGELMGKIDDLNDYHPPEILPNGDIIMRKKTPAEKLAEPKDEIEI